MFHERVQLLRRFDTYRLPSLFTTSVGCQTNRRTRTSNDRRTTGPIFFASVKEEREKSNRETLETRGGGVSSRELEQKLGEEWKERKAKFPRSETNKSCTWI